MKIDEKEGYVKVLFGFPVIMVDNEYLEKLDNETIMFTDWTDWKTVEFFVQVKKDE